MNLDNQAITDLVEDATRHHGAPWKRVVSGSGFYGVTDRNGAPIASSPGVSKLIAEAPTLITELLGRVEAAEKQVEIRANDSIAARIARQNIKAVEEWAKMTARLEAAEQAVQRVREMHHRDECGECDHCIDPCGNGEPFPCSTIRALDGGEQE